MHVPKCPTYTNQEERIDKSKPRKSFIKKEKGGKRVGSVVTEWPIFQIKILPGKNPENLVYY